MWYSRRKVTSSIVRRQKTRRVAGKPVHIVLLLSAGAVLAGVILYLWPQMRLVDIGYRYQALRRRYVQTLQQRKELQVELSTLRQLPRIENIVVQRLGLRPPQTSQVIYVHPEQAQVYQREKP